jgi:AcrR family transcriptional regulator
MNTLRQRRKEARPQELLEAALSLFVEKGFAATRTEEVAQRAGVSKGTLFLYFTSKEDLFKAVIHHYLGLQLRDSEQVVAEFQGSTPDLLRHLMQTWWQHVGDSQAGGICKIIIAEARNFPDLAQFYADEVIAPADKLIAKALQRGIERGEFRSVPLAETTHALIAPLLLMALNKHSIGACPVHGLDWVPARMLEANFDLLLYGLAVRDTTPVKKAKPK